MNGILRLWLVPVHGARVRAQRRLTNRVYPAWLGRIAAQLRCRTFRYNVLEFQLVLMRQMSKTIRFFWVGVRERGGGVQTFGVEKKL